MNSQTVWTFTWNCFFSDFWQGDLNLNGTWGISDIIASRHDDRWILDVVDSAYSACGIRISFQPIRESLLLHTHTHSHTHIFVLSDLIYIYIYIWSYAYFDLFCCSLCLIIVIILASFGQFCGSKVWGSSKGVFTHWVWSAIEPLRDGVVAWKPAVRRDRCGPVKEQVSRTLPRRNESFPYMQL